MLMRMQSFHSPPLYQEGSLGVRSIMPGWPEGVVSAKIPVRGADGGEDVLFRQVL